MTKVILEVLRALPSSSKKYVAVAFCGTLLVSLTQVVVVMVVAVFGATVASPEVVSSSLKFGPLRGVIPAALWQNPKLFLLVIAGCCAMVVAVNNSMKAFNEYWVIRITRDVEKFIGIMLVNGFLRLPYEWHLNKNSADLVMASNWSKHYAVALKSLIVIICDTVSVFSILGVALFIDPWMAIVAFGLLALLAGGLFRVVRTRLDKTSVVLRDAMLQKQRVLFKALHGLKDAKLFGKEDDLVEGYANCMEKMIRASATQELIRMSPALILEFLAFCMIFGVVAYLLYEDASYTRIAGTMTLVAAAGWKMMPCVNKILDGVSSVRKSWPFIQQDELYFSDINGAKLEGFNSRKPFLQTKFEMRLELKDASFAYCGTEKEVLSGVDVVVKKGEAIGIIGHSGAGKSTLVNLICGLYQLGAGAFLLDGQEVGIEEVRAWQLADVGYVPQTSYICDGTLAENVAYGVPADQIDLERVLECCKYAAMDFLDDLPQKVLTPIGERGVRLSGGQQQRVAIARALYKTPQVIVFDEATSSLDTKNEKAIQNTMYSFKGQMTLVIVAHRLSTVADCDRVYWLEDGKVRMSGAAEDVLKCYQQD